ncbi:MAG: hypothetical protein JW863_20975 [Chitinispirillaceae bacterium]|nr:hypothetical protein [Chitinispirillaceae bacterium]
MDNECGAPAFDNIDDVLAERIVQHGRTHSDHSTTPSAKHDTTPESGSDTSPEENHPATGFPPAGLLVAGIIVICLLLLLYWIFHRLSRK